MKVLYLIFPLLFSLGLSAFVPVTKCADYDCRERVMYKNYQDTWIYNECAPKDEAGWFSKPKGEIAEMSLIGVCKANGYDALETLVWQADTRFPEKHEREEEWKCNKESHKDKYPERGWTDLSEKAAIDQGRQSIPHATFKCINFPSPDNPVSCCNTDSMTRDTLKECVGVNGLGQRGAHNNFVVCDTWSSHEAPYNNPCGRPCDIANNHDGSVKDCAECCARETKEWNCFSESPTSSPISPSKSPTKSPISKNPTSAPITPSKSPTKSPTSAPITITSGPTTGSEKSVKSCAELGWSDAIKNHGPGFGFDGGIGVPGVCGTKTGVVCTNKVATFDEGKEICLGIGARLCTLEEYEALESGNSGCNYEAKKKYVWTSTECADGKYWSVRILSKGLSTVKQCSALAMSGRCCADVASVDAPTTSDAPTRFPTESPITTNSPTKSPTTSDAPTRFPTESPITTNAPTKSPTASDAPTRPPTESPISTNAPTKSPTSSDAPTRFPTESPITTNAPTKSPTVSDAPTRSPTESPINTNAPTNPPTKSPITSDAPTRIPTESPINTNAPTNSPITSDAPTRIPTESPITTNAPTILPTQSPITSDAPTRLPTESPITTNTPTRSPTSTPASLTESPTDEPAMTKTYASILCKAAGQDKKACKDALKKEDGKCKATKGKKGGCKLKEFYPVCEELKKRECKKAVSRGRCEAVDKKMKSCRTKKN